MEPLAPGSFSSWAALSAKARPSRILAADTGCNVSLEDAMVVHSWSRTVNRFHVDPLGEDAETKTTFETMLRTLVAHKPPTFVLENVMGTKSSSQQVKVQFKHASQFLARVG